MSYWKESLNYGNKIFQYIARIQWWDSRSTCGLLLSHLFNKPQNTFLRSIKKLRRMQNVQIISQILGSLHSSNIHGFNKYFELITNTSVQREARGFSLPLLWQAFRGISQLVYWGHLHPLSPHHSHATFWQLLETPGVNWNNKKDLVRIHIISNYRIKNLFEFPPSPTCIMKHNTSRSYTPDSLILQQGSVIICTYMSTYYNQGVQYTKHILAQRY